MTTSLPPSATGTPQQQQQLQLERDPIMVAMATLRNPSMAIGRTSAAPTTSQVWAFPEGSGWLGEDEFESEPIIVPE